MSCPPPKAANPCPPSRTASQAPKAITTMPIANHEDGFMEESLGCWTPTEQACPSQALESRTPAHAQKVRDRGSIDTNHILTI